MIEATTSELLANFTCGACEQYSLSEPMNVDMNLGLFPYVELSAICPKCGVENFFLRAVCSPNAVGTV
jgi:hypothetical protein